MSKTNKDEKISLSNEDKDELIRLLRHIETLHHSRIYNSLVAQSLFALAVCGTITNKPSLATWLSIAGLLVAILFTIVNVKNTFRIEWVMQQIKANDEYKLYSYYLDSKNFDKKQLSCLSRLFYWLLMDLKIGTKKVPIFSTAFLLSWGLNFICIAVWVVFLIYIRRGH